jgi:hypothetical protein
MSDCISKWENLIRLASAGRLFPLRFGGQSVTIRIPIASHIITSYVSSGPYNISRHGVAGNKAFFLAAGVAPLCYVMPVNAVNRVVFPFGQISKVTRTDVRVSVAPAP